MRFFQPAGCLLVVCFGSLMLVAGCSRSARNDMGMLQGKISFQNKPLAGGSIHFFLDQEKVGSFMIRGDGSYAAEIPLGPVKVAIETLSVKYQDREVILKVMKENGFDVPAEHRKPESPGFTGTKMTHVEIPERYSDPEKSGLEHNVVRGQQTRDFDLQ